MKLQLIRTPFKDCTEGKLYINGTYFSDTLEDPERETKIKGETAIPRGTYEVIINMSNRFQRMMPLLLNVPNFEGIRMHAGNTVDNTEGCPLVGKRDKPGVLASGSRLYEDKLTKLLLDAQNRGEKITIEIK